MPLSAADRMWAAVKDSTSIPALEAFRRQYGKENAVYDRLAEARVEELRKHKSTLAAPPPTPEPPRAADLPEILLRLGNLVPECVTPGRLMAFLKSRNSELGPQYDGIASEYMRLGEQLGIRWDFAFYQMIVETGALTYWRGTHGAGVRPEQYNFAGLGATGHGVRGESFKDIEAGVRAHIEHLVFYSGRPVNNPISERTRKMREWGILAAWQKTFRRPITFADLAAKWAPGNKQYASMLRGIAERFHSDHCNAPDPRPELLEEVRRTVAKTSPNASEAAERSRAKAYSSSGALHFAKRDFDRAIADFTRAIETDRRFGDPYVGRGHSHAEKGEYDRAIADYTKAIEIMDPRFFARLYSERGNAYSKKGDHERAIADHDKAIESDPRNVLFYINRGAAYTGRRDYDRAIADFAKAIQLGPKNPHVYHAYHNRGAVYEAVGRRAEAVSDFREALALNPNDRGSRDALKRLGALQ